MRHNFLVSVGSLSSARAIALLSQFFVLPILARTLTPSDFGIMALAMGIVIFANVLSDGGMARSLIKTPIDRIVEWSSVFWLLCATGIVLTTVIALSAPALSWFFGFPDLLLPLLSLSLLPLFLSISAAFAAEAEQSSRFFELSLVSVIATLVSLGVAVYMALSGYGIWALICQQLLLNGGRAILVVWISKFRPALRFDFQETKKHLRFGRDVLADSFVRSGREQLTPIVLGKAVSSAELGLFAMADRFLVLPTNGFASPFCQVLYVKLVAVGNDIELFRHFIIKATQLLGLVVIPAIAFVAVVSDVLFVWLLSEKWAFVAPLFVLAAGEAAFRMVTSLASAVFLARGETGRALRFSVETTSIWLILLAGSVAFGLQAVMIARSVWAVIAVPIFAAHLNRSCGVKPWSFFNALLPGIGCAAVVVLLCLTVREVGNFSGIIFLALAILIYLLVSLATLLLKKGDIVSTIEMLGQSKK